MDSKYLKILELLNKHSTQQIDIAPILLEFYPSDKVIDFESYARSKNSLFILLNNMQDEGLIKYIHPNIGGGNETNGYSWLHKVPVRAAITIKGQTYLSENKSKIKSLIINNLWALVIGILGTLISAIIIWKCNIPSS